MLPALKPPPAQDSAGVSALLPVPERPPDRPRGGLRATRTHGFPGGGFRDFGSRVTFWRRRSGWALLQP